MDEQNQTEKPEPEISVVESQSPGSFGLRLEVKEAKRLIPSGDTTNYLVSLENSGIEKDIYRLEISILKPQDIEEGAAEWSIKPPTMSAEGVKPLGKDEEKNPFIKRIVLEPEGKKGFSLMVNAPRSVKYGDGREIYVKATSEKDPAISEALMLTVGVRQSILVIKTSIGHERTVADSLLYRADASDAGVYSILAPPKLRGYLFVEVMNPDKLREMVKGIRRARGVVEGETSFEEIKHFLTPKPLVEGIVEGDIVELIAGPFKGEKARVQQIDVSKEEITVELFEAVVPIPVTVRGDHVRVLDTQKEEY